MVVGARNGAGVWLARPADARRVDGPRATDGHDRAPDAVLAGIAGLHRLLERSVTAPGSDGGPPTAPLPPLNVRIGGAAVTPMRAGGRLRFDLTRALNTYLAAAPGADPVFEMPVVVTSEVAGLVTVYPPWLEYMLPQGG